MSGPAGDRRPGVPADLRLAAFALGAWLSALATLYLSVAGVVVLAATAATGTATLLLFTKRRVPAVRPRALGAIGSRRAVLSRTGVALLLGALCGAGATTARVATRDAPVLTALAESRAKVTAELVVRDDPSLIGGGPGRPMYLVAANLRWIQPHDDGAVLPGLDRRVQTPARVLVLATHPAWGVPLPGQRLRVDGRLEPARGGDLRAAVISTGSEPAAIGRPSWMQRAAGSLRAGLQRACASLPREPGGLLPGLVLGDTSRLDPAVVDNFRATGLTHLTAVSGANVAIVLGFVVLLARWCRAGPLTIAVLCGLALVAFVILVRPSPSVVRAAAMGAIGLLALATGRTRAAVPALATAVTVLVVIDPELAGDPGFALSVLATGGLLLLAPRMRDAMRARGVPGGAAEALAIPAAAQLACGPVVAGLSGAVSLVAVPANLLAVPAVAPATIVGVAATIVSAVWPAAAEFAAWVGHWPAWWLVLVARYGADAPAGNLPWPGGVGGGLLLGALTVALLVAWRHRLPRRLVAVVAVASVVGAIPVHLVASGWPPPGWLVVACEVGQGDMVVLPAGPGAAVVVDAGPDPALADRCLDRLDVRVVRALVVSHFHVDHVGGVAGVPRGRTIEAVVTPAWPDPAGGRVLVERTASEAAVAAFPAQAGWRAAVGDVTLALLGPPVPLRGTRSDPNNNSLVIRAVVDGVGIMLAGDAEEEEQRAMLDRYGHPPLRAEILKVAHHGSAYQDVEFLDAVDPVVALVSVGADNDYGHPNAALMSRLARDGARILRTDQGGDLAVVRRDGGLAVVAAGPAGEPP